MLLCIKIMVSDGKINDNQIRFCMVGASVTEPPRRLPPFKWMSKKMWCGICELQDKFE